MTDTLNIVLQGSRLLQYLQVKILIGCSDDVNFLLFNVLIKWTFLSWLLCHLPTAPDFNHSNSLVPNNELDTGARSNNVHGLSIDIHKQKFRNSYIQGIF